MSAWVLLLFDRRHCSACARSCLLMCHGMLSSNTVRAPGQAQLFLPASHNARGGPGVVIQNPWVWRHVVVAAGPSRHGKLHIFAVCVACTVTALLILWSMMLCCLKRTFLLGALEWTLICPTCLPWALWDTCESCDCIFFGHCGTGRCLPWSAFADSRNQPPARAKESQDKLHLAQGDIHTCVFSLVFVCLYLQNLLFWDTKHLGFMTLNLLTAEAVLRWLKHKTR